MVKALQNLGDRLVGRLVPEVVAEAGIQEYQLSCGCFWDSPSYLKKVKNCSGGACGACFVVGPC
jgi:hypothetical protein